MQSICVAFSVLLISLFTLEFYFLGSVLLLVFFSPPRVPAQIIPHLKWPLFEYLGAELLFRYTVFILCLD